MTRSLLVLPLVLLIVLNLEVLSHDINYETRELSLYNQNTQELLEISYYNQGYFSESLKTLDNFMRDWRTSEYRRMDPLLYDILSCISQNGNQRITILSGYRSRNTNEKLREAYMDVAENSYHIKGQAADFKIPGVPINTLLERARKCHAGGIGVYDTFLHIDTGPKGRRW